MTLDYRPMIVTHRDENGITSITSIDSRHDVKGALYAQAYARARGDVNRLVTRFRSPSVINGEVAPAAPRRARKRVLIAGGAACWLGLMPLGMYTAGRLGALTATLIALALAALFLICVFPLRFLTVLAAVAMAPLRILSGHTCAGVHCPGCAG